jgi:23S rRNA (uracil1939-C5)-methyltransferase
MARKQSGLRFQPSGGSRTQSLPAGKKQRLKVERVANDGRGLAFVDGRTWFVSGAMAGEEVEARVLGARGQVVEARSERILQANPARRAEPCVHARVCGGCSQQHLPHREQLQLKQQQLAEQLSRLANIQPEQWAAPLSGPEFAYRRRARIAVRWNARTARLEVGFRASASQEIIGIADCAVLVEPLQPLLRGLPTLLGGLQAPREIGHVELLHGSASALLVRHTASLAEVDLARLQAFCSVHRAQLWLQGEGEPWALGCDQLSYRLDAWGLELAWRPGDFVQVNAAINHLMVAQALQWLALRPEERVLDLFCGLGNFALPLAREVAEVVAVEGAVGMVERAAQNAHDNALKNVHVHQADLSQALSEAAWAQTGFDAVVLDPPRDGALQVVKQMAGLGAKRVLYVSCNPATLARDSLQLLQQGYRLRKAGILDMFPQTAHVEAMALFER